MNIDTSNFSITEFIALVRSLLRRSNSVDWMQWLPLAEVCAEMPERMVEAFESLNKEDRYDFLDLLKDESAGVLADYVAVSLATQASSVSDEQLRVLVVECAELAQGRHQGRLERLRHQADVLTENIADARARLQDGFDVTAEIARLQMEFAKIKTQECERDDLFSQVHQLEQEILKMETRKRILDSYDRVGRDGYLAQLTTEVGVLDSQKSALELSIADATATRDQLKRQVASVQQEFDTVNADVNNLNRLLEETNGGIVSTRARLQECQDRQKQMQTEHTEMLAESQRIEKLNSDLEEKCRKERAILARLQEEARQAGMQDLADAIDAVYQQLPVDKSDEGFSDQPQSSNNRRTT